ncbi:putative oxidoreductase C-terminal domain-containing protein [Siphonobacter sp. SORGH_AS_0500]|uniref:putative oxidoreductase C-terminal domain-containing protein n=1 Tax=Siphonobacter sp. SORGH_AS_0500 TaxID=1864824 RepID=UPI00285564FD|nr:putative oxidoreductase C-terminal domain-containing protein [Siphonobacter sp. SORGH_AS_0500]MDR6197238.1 putative dehydrogenase [Siphonobacter sp. SORGH_AS_0500]
MNLRQTSLLGFCVAALMACSEKSEKNSEASVHLITLDPGHFHAALVQKSMYPEVSPKVYVYAPDGPDLQMHLDKIEGYNKRAENPTHWEEEVYQGKHYFEKMLQEKAGNVVVLAGNNQKKAEYIQKSIGAGFNVLSDKPMIIRAEDFEKLKESFDTAEKKNLLLYDIMTERFEISTTLQREFSKIESVFGKLEKGTPDNPAVTKESVHHFYKYVSGKVLTRPTWFMDVNQQGEGIVDVTTHLVDLVQWECFPEQSIDYQKDIKLNSARRWTTDMTRSQFDAITKQKDFPAYLKPSIVKDSILKVYSNGEINYQLKGVHAKVSVIWAYKAPEGGGDTHYSIMRGTKANLIIRQGPEQNFVTTLTIEPVANKVTEAEMRAALKTIQQTYPGVELKKTEKGWEVVIPKKYQDGHEAHFGRVTENYLKYLKTGKLPDWEVPNMISKYYTTTQALQLAKKSK